MTPTAAGRDVIAEARRTVSQADRVTAAAERHRRGAAGVLRVGFEASGAGELTTRARAEFMGAEPLRVALAWPDGAGRGDDGNPLVHAFADVVRELAAAP